MEIVKNVIMLLDFIKFQLICTTFTRYCQLIKLINDQNLKTFGLDYLMKNNFEDDALMSCARQAILPHTRSDYDLTKCM